MAERGIKKYQNCYRVQLKFMRKPFVRRFYFPRHKSHEHALSEAIKWRNEMLQLFEAARNPRGEGRFFAYEGNDGVWWVCEAWFLGRNVLQRRRVPKPSREAIRQELLEKVRNNVSIG